MTPAMSESDPITSNDPVVNGPSEDGASSVPVEPPAPEATADEAPLAEESVVEKVRRRLRAQAQPEPDRMRTLEERLIKLEELLTRQEEVARAPVEVAEVAPPVAPLIAEASVAAPLATVIQPPVAAVAPPAEVPPADPVGQVSRWGWLLLPALFQTLMQGLANFRLFLRMYVDPRYKMSWLGRLVPLAFLFFFVFSDWDWDILRFIFIWNIIPIFGPMINKLLLILFAWLTAKVLSREMRRYQQVIPDVPESLRWTNR